MTDLAQLLSTVQNSEFAPDSSKLRGTTTKRADAEGLAKIAKYNRTVGHHASPELGLDLAEIRAKVHVGSASAQYETP